MLFLHQLTFSTKIIICRKTNIFIFNALANKDTCRTSNRGVYMYYVEKNFFWDMFLGVPFQVGLFRGSVLTVLPSCRFVPHLQCYGCFLTAKVRRGCFEPLRYTPLCKVKPCGFGWKKSSFYGYATLLNKSVFFPPKPCISAAATF